MAWAFRYGPRRLASIRRHVAHSDPAISAEFRGAAPLVALGVLAAWAGLLTELRPELLRSGRLTVRA